LIHEELIGFFEEMFAGRDLAPIPTPEEFARARKNREQGVANRE
jgi:myo-inositol-1(or 4)-monophosphatase